MMNANNTFKKLSLLAALPLILTACGGGEEPLQEEQDNLQYVYDCRLASPDDYIFIDGTSPHFETVNSQGTSYSGDLCGNFMVDLDVTAAYPGANGTGRFELRGGFTSSLTPAQCNAASLYYRVDRKSRFLSGEWSSWAYLESATIQGEWIPAYPDDPAHCNLYIDTATFTKPSGRGTTHRYRLQVLPKLNGVVQPARAGWHWVY